MSALEVWNKQRAFMMNLHMGKDRFSMFTTFMAINILTHSDTSNSIHCLYSLCTQYTAGYPNSCSLSLSWCALVSLTPTRKGQLHLSGKNYEYLQRDQRTSTQWYWRIFKYFIGANHPLQNRRLLLWRLLICWRAKQRKERSAVRALFILSAEQKAQNDMQTPFT